MMLVLLSDDLIVGGLVYVVNCAIIITIIVITRVLGEMFSYKTRAADQRDNLWLVRKRLLGYEYFVMILVFASRYHTVHRISEQRGVPGMSKISGNFK